MIFGKDARLLKRIQSFRAMVDAGMLEEHDVPGREAGSLRIKEKYVDTVLEMLRLHKAHLDGKGYSDPVSDEIRAQTKIRIASEIRTVPKKRGFPLIEWDVAVDSIFGRGDKNVGEIWRTLDDTTLGHETFRDTLKLTGGGRDGISVAEGRRVLLVRGGSKNARGQDKWNIDAMLEVTREGAALPIFEGAWTEPMAIVCTSEEKDVSQWVATIYQDNCEMVREFAGDVGTVIASARAWRWAMRQRIPHHEVQDQGGWQKEQKEEERAIVTGKQ
jgi:hypothetical protein